MTLVGMVGRDVLLELAIYAGRAVGRAGLFVVVYPYTRRIKKASREVRRKKAKSPR